MDIHMAAAFILLQQLVLQFPFSSAGSSRPGCPTHCGSLAVPFPFGVNSDDGAGGNNCSIAPSFGIYCNYSTNPPKAFLLVPPNRYPSSATETHSFRGDNMEIIEISESQVRVKNQGMFVGCYGLQANASAADSHQFRLDYSRTPYTLSDKNWLTVVGCDDVMTLAGNGGCLAFCSDDYQGYCLDYANGSTANNGCCRTTIPRGTTSLEVHLWGLQGIWRRRAGRRRMYPCSFAFLAEKEEKMNQFRYQKDGLKKLTGFLDLNPVVASRALSLDWRIGTQNCSEARNSSAYACKGNSSCFNYNPSTVGGYLCRCKEGYAGNPYLTGSAGCQDINECANKSSNLCQYICINTPGGYNCSCPRGYYGSGRRNGFGCVKLPHKQSKMITVFVGLASGIGFILLLAICIWSRKVFQRRKNKNLRDKFFKRNGGLLLLQQQHTTEGAFGKTKLFSARELDKATDHFNESRILGQGGQGTVYKGMLSDGRIVAIKKSKMIDENQLEQFINEVAILSEINHRNVVKLLGCCLETEVPLLVYEFMPNGTLSELIHQGNTEFPISWSMLLKIAADIAGALAYLHSASSTPIYHRDIKSSNILLDEKYVVKVSDFGTSRSITADQTHLTTIVKGTFGYLDPEYFQSSQFTEKSDVYSFGVVLVELLTGQRAISRTQEEGSLATRFLFAVETNGLDTILDAKVLEEGKREEVSAVARLARKCLNLKGRMRPTMKEVATELESIRMSQIPSGVEIESQEGKLHETKGLLPSDIEYTWTTRECSATTSSTDTYPMMSETQ